LAERRRVNADMAVERHYPLSTYLLFAQNWRFGLDGGFPGRFFAPTWSLAVEEHFYLLLPLLATRIEPRRLSTAN